jgi:hypothetical protein
MRQTVVLMAAIAVSGFVASQGLALDKTKQQLPVAGAVETRQTFSCDVNQNTCSCTGSKFGADCKAMKKNCDEAGMVPNGDKTGYWCVMKD